MKIRLALAALSLPWAMGAGAQQPVTWRFDSVSTLAGVAATAVGSPMVIPTNTYFGVVYSEGARGERVDDGAAEVGGA